MVVVGFVAVVLAASACGATGGGSGSLDRSFGDGGRVFASFSGYDTASGVAVQRDGKVLLSGHGGKRIAVARFSRAGLAGRKSRRHFHEYC